MKKLILVYIINRSFHCVLTGLQVSMPKTSIIERDVTEEIRDFQILPDTQHDIVVDKVKLVMCILLMKQQQEHRGLQEIWVISGFCSSRFMYCRIRHWVLWNYVFGVFVRFVFCIAAFGSLSWSYATNLWIWLAALGYRLRIWRLLPLRCLGHCILLCVFV